MNSNRINGTIFIVCGIVWALLGFRQYAEKGSVPMAALFVLVGISFAWNGVRYFLRDRK